MTETRTILTAFAIAALMCFTACRSSKKAVGTGNYTPAGQEVLVDATDDFKALAGSYRPWEDVSVPVKLEMSQPKKFNISGTLKMKHGESILISARMFGFEVASIYADNDSVLIYAKAMDMYMSEPVAELSRRYGITLSDIQSLLLGQAFIPGKGAVDAGDVRNVEIGKKRNTTFGFSPRKMPRGLSWEYTADSDGTMAVLASIAVEPASGSAVDCVFGNAVQSPAGMVAGTVGMATKIKDKDISLSLISSADKARWNSGIDIARPKVSAKARRVGQDDILKMLKNL